MYVVLYDILFFVCFRCCFVVLACLLIYFPMLTASSFSSLMIAIQLRMHASHNLRAAYWSNLLVYSIVYHEPSCLPLQPSVAVVCFASASNNTCYILVDTCFAVTRPICVPILPPLDLVLTPLSPIGAMTYPHLPLFVLIFYADTSNDVCYQRH